MTELNTSEQLKKSGKKLGIGVVAVLVLGGLQYQYNIIPIRSSGKAVVPQAVELPTEAVTQVADGAIVAAPLPTTTPSTKVTGPSIRLNAWAWNAQMGLFFANGGPKTTKDSLMEKHGVRLSITRQDDTSKSQAEQIKFAELLSKGDPNPGEGVHFVTIMGDGAAVYLSSINKALSKLGPDYRAEIIGAVGYSGNSVSGEDTCMGLSEWKDDPSKLKGSLFAGVLRDGDWNICQYYFQQNGVKNNPDETTFDPDAVNWVATDDYLKAADLYISGYSEDRKVVHDGKMSNESKVHLTVNGVATWTPGDVNIAKKKGGLVKLLSTKENAFQMPSVVIGIHKWNEAHGKLVANFLGAAFEGGDQVRNFEPALQRAGKASYAIYAEESPAYWVKYYKGVVERDKTGIPIPLGGSRVSNLGDNLVLFGLTEGAGDVSSSMFKASYEGFGNISKQQYPKLITSFPTTAEAVNLTFLQSLAETSKVASKPEANEYEASDAAISDVVAKRNWSIQFETGKASFTPLAVSTLNDLYEKLTVNKLNIEVDGHTDNVGNPSSNLSLSEARAEAVKQYLKTKAPSLFPDSRIQTKGYGDSQPVADNLTNEGKAKNRRVTIILGTK